MALNLVKLCVGCDTPEALLGYISGRLAQGRRSMVHTRQTPKRGEELLDGGSLFWVFRGVILGRQSIVAIETLEDGGQRRCEIELNPVLVRTEPQPRRAFQGWRYLDAADAPKDLPSGDTGEAIPAELARELRLLGAW